MNKMEKYTLSLFGHRKIFNTEIVRQKLYKYLKSKIEGKKVRVLIGTHGDFDRLALEVCKQLKKEGFDIHIDLVYTSQKQLIKDMEMDKYIGYYKDVETMMYEIENEHYKRQIIVSNQKMVDASDEVVVYHRFDRTYGGTMRIMKYAQNKNKPMINLFDESDKIR